MKTFSLLAVAILSTVGTIQLASAKSTTQIPGICSQSSTGTAYFLKQGSRFNLGFAVNGDERTIGVWHTQVLDNGSKALLDYTTEVAQQGVSITALDIVLARGTHRIDYSSENLTTGEICSAQVVTKV